jgi:endoglucanase
MLKELSDLLGVSSQEDDIREFIKEKIRPYVQETTEDAYGNMICRVGEPSSPRIMLAAHMDEVGFMVTHINKNGLLRFKPIGLGVQTLLGKTVIIGPKRIPGVIGCKPIHLAQEEELKKLPELKTLFIDIGASSREEAEKSVEAGACGTFDTVFRSDGDIIFGKAFDNRIGCYMLIELIKQHKFPAYYAFTVQEEMGLRGARIAGHQVSPDVALAVDTTGSAEWPSDKDLSTSPRIGLGPVLTVADLSIICDRKLVSVLEEAARSNKIPYQFKKPGIGGTDAGQIHLAKAGVPTAVFSVCARYIHSPMAIASSRDIQEGIRLLALALPKIGATFRPAEKG